MFNKVLLMLVMQVSIMGKSPVISELNVDPITGPPGTEYTISLRIDHPLGSGSIVEILYQIREAGEAIEVLLRDDGLGVDLEKEDGIYSGSSLVPQTAARHAHRFEVFVRDKAGHKSNVLEYRFMVLNGIEV